jgi:hypothetical protein
MLVGVVPEVLHDKSIFRQILDKRRQHVVSGRQLPIRLKFASEGKGRTSWAPARAIRDMAA